MEQNEHVRGGPQSGLQTVELADYLRVIRERKWVIVASVLAAVALVLAVSLLQTPRYRATAKLLYSRANFEAALFDMPVFRSTNQERDVQTAAGLVKLDSVASQVKESISSERDISELLDMVTVEPQGATDVVDISAVSTDPEEAAAIANGFAEKFIEFRRAADRAAITEAREQVAAELEQLSTEERSSDFGLILRDKLESLRILEEFQDGGFRLVQQAEPPEEPFSPQPVRNGALALIVGLIGGLGLAFLLAYLDRRIKDEEAMEREFGLPVLASVPTVGGRWTGRSKELGLRSDIPVGFPDASSPLLEPYRVLRSNLQFFDVDSGLRTLLISSALPQQGKTVTSINLALSLALSGERVILLEADLRRPMIHTYLRLSNTVGVTNVLAGAQSFAEALQLVQIDELAPGARAPRKSGMRLQKNMYCVTAGPLPPNPAELIGSRRMADVLEQAKQYADYVVIDSPPLLLAADGLYLARHVDGVILTARVGETTRDEARQVTDMLGRANARVLGVVASGVKPQSLYYYKYGYYESGSAEGGSADSEGAAEPIKTADAAKK